MNVLFIVPLNEPYDTVVNINKTDLKHKLNANKNIKKLNIVYPSGVLSIAAYIKKHYPGANIRILDYNVFIDDLAKRKKVGFSNYKFKEFVKEGLSLIDNFIPDIIGISTLFSSVYRDLGELAACLHDTYKDSLVVCGGHLASTLYDRVYKDNITIDAVCFGESEKPMLEILEAVFSGKKDEYLAASNSWITKTKTVSDDNFIPQYNLIDDLDEIPSYDLNMLLFPDAYYDSSSFVFMPQDPEDCREMIMFSTRGCPFNCVFCASHQVHGKKVRYYSADRVKKDILFYRENYGINKFVFYDDHFLMDKERALEILSYISQNKLVASIINPAFFSIDDDIALAMKQAGVKSVILSIESGNDKTFRNIIHKPSSLVKAGETVDALHKVGINVATNILIGLPGETKESIDIGTEYLCTTGFNWFNTFVVAPLPGSELYKICKENGYFAGSDDISIMEFKRCVIKTSEFAPEYIEKKVYEINLLLNYVNNYDMRSGNYSNALMLFEKVINSVIDTHAFAYYFAAKCCKKLQLEDKCRTYQLKYEKMLKIYPFWKEYASQFNLEKLD